MNTYKLPFLNPVRFHQIGVGDFAYNLIPSIEFQKGWNQPFMHGDSIYCQILSTSINPFMKVEMIDIEGNIFKTWTPFSTSITYGSSFVFAFNAIIPSASITPNGIYFLKLTIQDADGTFVFVGEPLNIQLSFDDCLKIEYTHDQNEFDTIFVNSDGTQYLQNFIMRVPGGMKSEGFQPAGKYTMFQDQDYNSVMLQSTPYNVLKMIFGGSEGVPNHVADKVNRIFGLSTVKINGEQYSRNEGAKIERNGDPDYPLAGWSLDVVKTGNDYSESFQLNTVPLTCDNTIVTVDSDLITVDQTTY